MLNAVDWDPLRFDGSTSGAETSELPKEAPRIGREGFFEPQCEADT
jgi:hypothetical protein